MKKLKQMYLKIKYYIFLVYVIGIIKSYEINERYENWYNAREEKNSE